MSIELTITTRFHIAVYMWSYETLYSAGKTTFVYLIPVPPPPLFLSILDKSTIGISFGKIMESEILVESKQPCLYDTEVIAFGEKSRINLSIKIPPTLVCFIQTKHAFEVEFLTYTSNQPLLLFNAPVDMLVSPKMKIKIKGKVFEFNVPSLVPYDLEVPMLQVAGSRALVCFTWIKPKKYLVDSDCLSCSESH